PAAPVNNLCSRPSLSIGSRVISKISISFIRLKQAGRRPKNRRLGATGLFARAPRWPRRERPPPNSPSFETEFLTPPTRLRHRPAWSAQNQIRLRQPLRGRRRTIAH